MAGLGVGIWPYRLPGGYFAAGPAREVTAEDVDRVVGELAAAGRAVSTRRNYLQVFKGFHRLLEARKAAEIEAAFGVRLTCPVDEFNSARHFSDDSPDQDPPAPERVAKFFAFLKARIATLRKYAPPPGTMPCSVRDLVSRRDPLRGSWLAGHR